MRSFFIIDVAASEMRLGIKINLSELDLIDIIVLFEEAKITICLSIFFEVQGSLRLCLDLSLQLRYLLDQSSFSLLTGKDFFLELFVVFSQLFALTMQSSYLCFSFPQSLFIFLHYIVHFAVFLL